MHDVALTHLERKAIENYIEERTQGLSYPIDITVPIQKRFNIFDVKILWGCKGPPSKLHPVAGGFIIYTRIPPNKERDFRFVLAWIPMLVF